MSTNLILSCSKFTYILPETSQYHITTYILSSNASPGLDIIKALTNLFLAIYPICISLNLTDSVESTAHSFPFITK